MFIFGLFIYLRATICSGYTHMSLYYSKITDYISIAYAKLVRRRSVA